MSLCFACILFTIVLIVRLAVADYNNDNVSWREELKVLQWAAHMEVSVCIWLAMFSSEFFGKSIFHRFHRSNFSAIVRFTD